MLVLLGSAAAADPPTVFTNVIHSETSALPMDAETDAGGRVGRVGMVGPVPVYQKEAVIERVATIGLPIVQQWEEQAAVVTATDEEPLFKNLTFEASNLLALRRLRGGGGAELPVDLTTEMEWDAETETYSLSHVKLELFGERFWVVRDWREDSDEEWNLGIQFKKTW